MSQAVRAEAYESTIPLPTTTSPVVEEVGSVGMLFKSPQTFVRLVSEDQLGWQQTLMLLATSLGFYSLYGLAMGTFAGGNSLWQATLKAPLVLMGSTCICAPSLYLLLCLSGMQIHFRQVVGMLAGVAGVSSAAMAAFAPLAWLFGVSTSSVPFMIGLHATIWTLGFACGVKLLSQVLPGGIRGMAYVAAWAAIFLIVSAQMVTYFRPVLGVSPTGKFREREKQFFFQHLQANVARAKPVTELPAPAPAPAPMPIPDGNFIPLPSVKPVSN